MESGTESVTSKAVRDEGQTAGSGWEGRRLDTTETRPKQRDGICNVSRNCSRREERKRERERERERERKESKREGERGEINSERGKIDSKRENRESERKRESVYEK